MRQSIAKGDLERRKDEMKSSIRNGSAPGLVIAVAMAFLVALLAVPAALGGSEHGLDPWAYNVLHRSTSEVITEHSAGQNIAQGVGKGGPYGSFDPWAYSVLHGTAPALLTEHSLGQDPNRNPIAAQSDYVPAVVSGTGFDWSDAGIGAGATFVLLALAGTVVVRRRRLTQAQF